VPISGVVPEGYPLQLEGMIPGFRDAVLKMQKGGKYQVEIPAEMAYGASPPPGSPIPASADLTFEIELIDFMPMAEAEKRFQQLQQMMMERSLQGEEGAPAPAPAPGAAN